MNHKQLTGISKQHDRNKLPGLEKVLVNNNTFPFKANIGMVFTTYVDHMPYMKYALSKYREIKDMYIIGAYDNRTVTPISPERNLPYNDIWSLAHMWVSKHHTFGGHAKRHGWIWSNIYASTILRQFPNIKYIFISNGDCIWEKPQGVYTIIKLLKDNEFITGQSETRHTDGFNFIHTCSMLFQRESYFSFIDYIVDKVSNETKTVSFSPESLINTWANVKVKDTWEKKRKWEHAPIQPLNREGKHDTYCETYSDSTWKQVLGFRNLEAEKNYRCTHHKQPLDKKYFDLRDRGYYKDNDKNHLIKYYQTGDEIHLKKWWYLDPNLPRAERIKRMYLLKSKEIRSGIMDINDVLP